MAKAQNQQDSHAAGSGSTTGDPGQAREPQRQQHSSPDDHIESAAAPPVPILPPEVR